MTTTEPLRVGVFPPFDLLARGPATAASYLRDVEETGLDHVCCADHVSFAGAGFDGLVHATALAALHPRLPVHLGVYLLPLRHPVLVARQLADLDAIAPGRLVFGVGIGGEDRHEVEICGVDPGSRGRRMEEALSVLRGLSAGAPLTFHGEFFDIDTAVIHPSASVPIVIGGRSDQAIRRVGRLGDGWLGIWASPRRFGQAVEMVAEEAARAGRASSPGRHAMQVWCGLADRRDEARGYLAASMEAFYRIPFATFERYCPYGDAQEVAAFLAPYVEAGCREFNLIPQGAEPASALALAAEVRRLLIRT
jgi:alkanesulfonate monooxygenase SsuD/methylene tetrahydromethanopterin reductase-like flavin-dependent oxidoreductase (luciferase family)